MNRISPNVGRQDSLNDIREIPAREFFTRASEVSQKSNFRARTIAQILEEDPR